MKAHFKTKSLDKLTADQVTRLAELVEDHARPVPTEDDMPM